MMTVGTSISANGAEAYFKADFIKQETLLNMSADKNKEADKNTPVEVIADAESEATTIVSSALNDSATEDSDGENGNGKTLGINNELDESEPFRKSGYKKIQAANALAKDSAAEILVVKNLGIETPSTENSKYENLILEKPNSVADKIDFGQTRTLWIGKLSEELKLTGIVAKEDFASLARGVHPHTGERFIRHVKPRTVTNAKGKTHQTKSHRAGLDQTLNAPKSVSLVAPYDERVITVHWRSAIKAVETIEEFTKAKMGNVKLPERTGKAVYAAFLHFEARPDFKSNFAAPDLHTHFFEFNFTRTADGRSRALETREIYRCQKLATAVYRTELLKEMTDIGYEMRIDGKTGAPEVAAISRAYIEASSPRQTEIKRTAAELGIKSTKIVASNYRRGKNFDPAEMRQRWDALDMEFGSQAANAAAKAKQRTAVINLEKQMLSSQKQISASPNKAERTDMKVAAIAADFVIAQAKEQENIEVSKRKWITRQSLLTEVLNFSPAELTIDKVKTEFIKREKNGELEDFDFDRRKTKRLAEKTEIKLLEKSEIKLEINQKGGKPFEKNYDKSGILQSRTRTSGGSSEEKENTDGNATVKKHSNRTSRDAGFGNGDKISESKITSPINGSTVISSNTFIRSRNGESGSKTTTFRAEHHRENSDSAIAATTGAEQNPAFRGRERKPSDRSGSAGSKKSNDRRITRQRVEKSEGGGESGKLSFKPTDPAVENKSAIQENSNSQPTVVEVEPTPRLESGASVEKIKIAGTVFAPFRNNRTDDEATRSGQEITGNNRENFSTTEYDAAENKVIDADSERGVDRREKRNDKAKDGHRKIKLGLETSRTAGGFGKISIKDGDKRVKTFSNQVAEPQIANGGGFESKRFTGTRISNGCQRAADIQSQNSTNSISRDDGTDRFDSATDSDSEGISGFERAEIREKSRMDDAHLEAINRAAHFSDVGSGILFWNEQGFKRESSGGEKNEGRITEKIIGGRGNQNEDGREFGQHDNDIAANIPGSGENVQSIAAGADKDYSGGTNTRRRTAEKAAQIINIRRFSGGLDPQIVAEWTSIIEKSDTADFLNEVVKPKSREEKEELFGHLDAQAKIIAGQLKLPQPQPEAQPNILKLASALTKIETANYEQSSGESLSDKVIEVLVEKNMRRAAAPPRPEQIERLRETLNDSAVESTLKLSSTLEVETFNALLDPAGRGFDASVISQAQQSVELNEAAAWELATLIQIAYGGQANAFDDNFKDDLAEQIYYAPIPANEIYRDFRSFDWRQTIEAFAPAVNSLAEQHKIEIKKPDNDLERNKLLTDFVARQLIEAHESQNSQMEKYIQNQMTANILRTGSVEVSEPQQNTIADLTDPNIEPPKFSNALEANAYNISKYDDEKKVTIAVKLTDKIEEVARVKAEKQATMETEKVQGFMMR